MARPIEEIVAAWRALDGHSPAEGWRTIRVSANGPYLLMAGRYFPANLEALLIGFDGLAIPHAERFPEGAGFAVIKVENHNNDSTRVWLALSRRHSGNRDLFTAMAADVAESLDYACTNNANGLLQTFLGRVRAWQEFMRKGALPLGPEAEVGLVGELCFLSLLLDQGIMPLAAVEAWEGPLGGAQDFILGTGAVEVKSTIAKTGFQAKIGTLEQLDDSVRAPLFVAGQRLALAESGLKLPEWIDEVLFKLGSDEKARALLSDRLLAAGYIGDHAEHYVRRFAKSDIRLIEVGDGFPRIVPGTVPKGIRKASYEIDLDQTGGTSSAIVDVLNELGVA